MTKPQQEKYVDSDHHVRSWVVFAKKVKQIDMGLGFGEMLGFDDVRLSAREG